MTGTHGLEIVNWILAAGVFAGAAACAGISIREHEPRAAGLFTVLALPAALPYLVWMILPEPLRHLMLWAVPAATAALAALFLCPFPGKTPGTDSMPEKASIDERDIIFARFNLQPGSDRFSEYYSRRPERLERDTAIRALPGLMSPGAAYRDAVRYAAADASFKTIAGLHSLVDGMLNTPREPVTAAAATEFILAWAGKLGAVTAGITRLKPCHFYTHVGRGPEYGSPVSCSHTHGVAVTVEMDKFAMDAAPAPPVVMESAQQYLKSGAIAIQIAMFIRSLGYSARAHIDGNYRVICPLVARDAGLGEIGRMGLLMTPQLGPRVRIAVVTTDLPLVSSRRISDPSVLDFCSKCRKCARACPSHAIPTGPRELSGGVLRWVIDPDACYEFWCKSGTDCGRCMAVCPYSHPANAMHDLVRYGVRVNPLFRRTAVWMDDLMYGK